MGNPQILSRRKNTNTCEGGLILPQVCHRKLIPSTRSESESRLSSRHSTATARHATPRHADRPGSGGPQRRGPFCLASRTCNMTCSTGLLKASWKHVLHVCGVAWRGAAGPSSRCGQDSYHTIYHQRAHKVIPYSS